MQLEVHWLGLVFGVQGLGIRVQGLGAVDRLGGFAAGNSLPCSRS